MREASEVGLSLALASGVARSAMVARRDILAIDNATGAGATSIHQLQRTADAIYSPAGGLVSREKLHLQAASASEAPVDEPISYTPKVISSTLGVPASSSIAARQNTIVPERLARSALREDKTKTALLLPTTTSGEAAPTTTRLQNFGILGRAADSNVNSAGPETRAQQGVDSPPGAVPLVAGQKITILRMGNTGTNQATRLPAAPVAGAPFATAMVSLPTPGPDALAVQGAPAAPNQMNLANPASSSMTSRSLSPESAFLPDEADAPGVEAWRQPQTAGRFLEQQGTPGNEATAPPSATPSAPPANMREQPQIEGDVYLDGTLVGRWVSRFLSREASRSPAGPTGFDKRRSPLMPGPSVGM